MNRRNSVLLIVLALLAASHATAQTWAPAKPIKILVGSPPGGSNDIMARAIGQRLSEVLGQPVLVDNRPGASQMLAADLMSKSAPDGSTIYISSSTYTTTVALQPKQQFDPVNDVTGVALLGNGPLVLVVHPSVPARSVKEFVALAKSRPGKLNFGSAGGGATSHMAAEMLKVMSGIDMVHVPFKGAAPAIVALLSGEVDMAILDTPPLLPQIRSGKLRVLAVASERRSRVLPEVPTIAESGMPGYHASSWHALFAPAGTPREIVARLHSEVARVVKLPDITERLSAQGVEPVANTPEQLAEFIKSEITRWGRVVRASRAKID